MTKVDFELVLGQICPHTPMELGWFYSIVKDGYGIDKDEQSENAFYHFVSSRCLTLHGYGEPLLDPHIVERVQACTDRRIATYFSCMPINIKLDKILALMDAGLTVLKFSMIEPFASEKILEVLEHQRGETKIVITKIATKDEDNSDFLHFWQDCGVYVYVKSQDNRWFYNEGVPENRSHYMKSYCQFPWTSMTVLSNGVVVPCTQDYDGEMEMGNIREQALKDIWNGKKYEKFRQAHISGVNLDNYKCKDRCDIPIMGGYAENRE